VVLSAATIPLAEMDHGRRIQGIQGKLFIAIFGGLYLYLIWHFLRFIFHSICRISSSFSRWVMGVLRTK